MGGGGRVSARFYVGLKICEIFPSNGCFRRVCSQKSKSFPFNAVGVYLIQKILRPQPSSHPFLLIRSLDNRGCREKVKLSFSRMSECCDEGDVLCLQAVFNAYSPGLRGRPLVLKPETVMLYAFCASWVVSILVRCSNHLIFWLSIWCWIGVALSVSLIFSRLVVILRSSLLVSVHV